MTWLAAIWSELLGLFVDDGWFALAILVWLAVCLALMRVGVPAWLPPIALFVGLAAILIESVIRRSRAD